MAAAKTTTVGLKEPVESRLDGITGADSPKIDGSAMRTVRGEQTHGGADHNAASAFAALFAAGSGSATRLARPEDSSPMPSSSMPVSSMIALPPVTIVPPVADHDAADTPLRHLEAAH